MDAVEPVNAFYGAVSWPVLHQIAAEKHIDGLHSPAYTQDRLAKGRKIRQQIQFQRVPFRLQIPAGCVFLAVTPGFHVPAAGQQQAVAVRRPAPEAGNPSGTFHRQCIVLVSCGITKNIDPQGHSTSSFVIRTGKICPFYAVFLRCASISLAIAVKICHNS